MLFAVTSSHYLLATFAIFSVVLLPVPGSGHLSDVTSETMACAYLMGSELPVREADRICDQCVQLFPVPDLGRLCRKSCYINMDFAACATIVNKARASGTLRD
ncbi:molt-inhibiting hormone-like [Hyalella azteca]|uniref:Molt-inhibiting hormone-like n=1 Tax=Hyalella azteca TaxID=294128 RepID=A0A8B7PAA4_HYAAZ|nr:molt-inhibiting hormone-like [Hyalella azteca]